MSATGLEPKRDPTDARLLNQVRQMIRLKHYSIRTLPTLRQLCDNDGKLFSFARATLMVQPWSQAS